MGFCSSITASYLLNMKSMCYFICFILAAILCSTAIRWSICCRFFRSRCVSVMMYGVGMICSCWSSCALSSWWSSRCMHWLCSIFIQQCWYRLSKEILLRWTVGCPVEQPWDGARSTGVLKSSDLWKWGVKVLAVRCWSVPRLLIRWPLKPGVDSGEL